MNLNPLALRLHFGRGGVGGGGNGSIAASKTMEWTNDDALELIEQYRHHTELWNRADPKYKDKLCRFRAWSEIADRFGCSKAEVERKMNVLLTQYRREKHKMLVKMYQGINPNPSKWYAFKRFDFMESGGGGAGSASPSSGGILVGTSNGATHPTTTAALTTSGVNGHSAAAAAVALSGLTAGRFDSASITISPSTSHHQHRRIKSKEMKYFGAMGLNLPMLLANNQPLESSVWSSAVGQYSPPISERNHQLRVPLSMSFSATQNELNVANETARSLFGGSSGNSDLAVSPQKPMETTDIDDKDETKRELRSSPMVTAALHPSDRGGDGNGHHEARGDGGGGAGGGGGVGADVGSSPIPNTNTHEAHQLRLMRVNRDQEDLDIKQELVDYFHAPHPPAPPDSHRSFSSTEEMRMIGGGGGGGGGSANGPGCDSDDYAQDLRVSAAAAAAASKRGLDFSHLMMASSHTRRRSTESLEEKYTPLNMRKVSTTSSTTTTGAGASATSTNAGHVLMHSLCSNESLSEDTMVSGQQRVKSVVSQDAASTSAAAAAAATLYAESLRRDDCDFIGSNVSLKLRAMDRSQRIIAEKLISEVLFYGQFNELERSARIQPK